MEAYSETSDTFCFDKEYNRAPYVSHSLLLIDFTPEYLDAFPFCKTNDLVFQFLSTIFSILINL